MVEDDRFELAAPALCSLRTVRRAALVGRAAMADAEDVLSTSWERRRGLLFDDAPGRHAPAAGPASPASVEELSSLSVSGSFGSSLSLSSIVRRKSLEVARGLASNSESFSPPPRRQRSRPPSSPVKPVPTIGPTADHIIMRAVLGGWAKETCNSVAQRKLLAAVRSERLAAADGVLRLVSSREGSKAVRAALFLLSSAFRAWARRGEEAACEMFPAVGSQRARRVAMLARCHAGWQIEAFRAAFFAWYAWLCDERLRCRTLQHQVAALLDKRTRRFLMHEHLAVWRLATAETPALEARRSLELCKNESSTVKLWNRSLSAEVETLRAEVERLTEELSAATLACDHGQGGKSTFSMLSPKAGEDLFGLESLVQCVDESMDATCCLWSEISDSVIPGPVFDGTPERCRGRAPSRAVPSIRPDSLVFSPDRTGDCTGKVCGKVCAIADVSVLDRTCRRIYLLAWRSQTDIDSLLRLMLEQGTHADDAACLGKVLAGWRSVVERRRRRTLAQHLLQAVDSTRSVFLLRCLLCEWRSTLSLISMSSTFESSAPSIAWRSARSREPDPLSANSSAITFESSPAAGRGCSEVFHSAKIVSPNHTEDRPADSGAWTQSRSAIRVLLPAPSVSPSAKACPEREVFCPTLLPAPTLSPGVLPLASAWSLDGKVLTESPRSVARRMPSPNPRSA